MGTAEQKARVLAVDDEPLNLELLERSLRRTYHVITAESGAAALEVLRSERNIAAIVSDYLMPGMNGAEFLAETLDLHPAARRVMITGYADADNIITAVNSGRIHHLLKKPFTPEDLLEILEPLVAGYLKEQTAEASDDATAATDPDTEAGASQSMPENGVRSERVEPDRDPLTGIYNHRGFQERLREELVRAKRYQHPMAVLYADVDSFSDLNDQHGYEVGDQVLGDLGDLLRNNNEQRLRDSDVVARFGGEEFALLLPETDKEGARQTADRLRELVQKTEFAGGTPITVSVGVAAFPIDASEPNTLVRCAELAQREAKRRGRNRVFVYAPDQITDLVSDKVDTPVAPEPFPSYHSRMPQIIDTLRRDRSVSVLFVDLSQLRRIEAEFGVAQHTELFSNAGAILDRLRGDKLRRDDVVCRTEDADAYVVFLAPQRNTSGPPANLERISARVQEEIQREIIKEVGNITREKPRIVVGYSRVINNPMLRPERLIVRLVSEARQCAGLLRERTAHHDKALLQEVILHDKLGPVYQPIVQLESGDVFGYEALIRGPRDSSLETPAALFSTADEVDLTFELDRACFRGALRGAMGLEPVHRLFVNLLPMSFYDTSFIEKEVANLLDAAALTPANLVFEISERLAIDNFSSFREALASYTAMGFGMAIDDVGTRHSNLETVMALRPHFIKISDVLTRGVSQSTVKREMLRSLQRIAEAIDAVVVAEGIETPNDLAVLSELGVRYGQGFYLARPGPPFPRLRPTVRRAVRALAQPPRAPIATATEAGAPGCDEDTGIHQDPTNPHLRSGNGTREPVTEEMSTDEWPTGDVAYDPADPIANGTHPGFEVTAEVERELTAGDKTQPRIMLGQVVWRPLKPEDLGSPSEEPSLLSSLLGAENEQASTPSGEDPGSKTPTDEEARN